MTYWLSNRRMIARITTQDGIITNASAFVRRFIGQPKTNLIAWMSKIGPVKVQQKECENEQSRMV